MSETTAFSPASIGNLGIGFDILGQSFAGAGDRATVRRIQSGKVQISAIRNAPVALPLEAEKNTAGAALIALREALKLPYGFDIELDKGIAFGSGMGGSAASCVAALVAANALLDAPLSAEQLYPFASPGRCCSAAWFLPRSIIWSRFRCRTLGTACSSIPTPCSKRAARAKR